MRVRSFSVLLALALVVAACSSGTTETTDGDATSGDTSATTTTTEASNDQPDDGEVFEFVIAHTISSSDALHIEAVETARIIEERTEGRVTFEIFPDGQMGGFDDMIQRVERGENLITQQIPGFAVDYGVPEIEVLTGPFLSDGYDDIQALVNSELFGGWQQRLHDEGIATLAWNWYFGKRHIVGNAPYPEPSDLDGVSIRVPTTPMWVHTFDALPATPIQIEFAELYTALEQGVVDAAEMPIFALLTLGFAEVVDHVTLTGHFDNVNAWAMNADLFDELPEDLRQIMIEEFQAGGVRQSEAVAEAEAAQRAELESEHGVTFVEANVDAYRELTAGVYDEFEAWPAGLLDQVREAMGK